MKFTMTKIAAAAALAFVSSTAFAGIGDGQVAAASGVFNMASQDGFDMLGVVGDGEVPINVDTAITGWVNQDAGTWSVASTNVFYGLNWTASGGTLITAPGSYSVVAGPAGNGYDGTINYTVAAGQVAGVIDFAWGATTGIKVVNIWNVGADGSLTAAVVPGMENGPFPGFNAQFNFAAGQTALITPVPEASTYGMMLAGLGLVGFAVRRRKLMA